MEDKTELQESCISFAKHLKAGNRTWEDFTSYSRDARIKIPTAFSTKVGDCRVTITCAHRDYKPAWVFHCYELGFNTKFIGEGLTAQQAAEKALILCEEKVQKLYDSFIIL